MSELSEKVFRHLGGRTAELALELFDMPAEPVALLRTEVVAYNVKVRDTAVRSTTIDYSTAQGIGKGCMVLLELADDADAVTRALIQVACRYFVLEEDGGRDLHAPLGFDDDAEVFNAVANHIGRPDLIVSLD